MPLLKRRTSREAEIPTASMADIAFLLLVFFLVTTTIDADSGIYMQLPPKLADTPPPEIQDRNLLTVLVNSQGDVLVEGEYMQIANIRDEVKRHVLNEGQQPGYSDSPDKAIVSFKTERGTRYQTYIEVLDEIKASYIDIRNEYARQLAGVDYNTYKARLAEGETDLVAEKYPIKISLAEPDPGT